MKKFKTIILATVGLFAVGSCELDQQNPNDLPLESQNPDYMLNSIQVGYASFFNENAYTGMELTRLINLFGQTYEAAYTAQSFDDRWSTAYATVLKDCKTLIPVAEERQLFRHAAIAKIIQAQTLINLVDLFGDVPYEEALDDNNFNPNVTDDQKVYDAAIGLLDAALADLAKVSLAVPATDLYYGGSNAKWITLAKTLKFRAYFQQRLVKDVKSQLQALATENDLIDTDAEEFAFKYGTNAITPDARHPQFTNNYVARANDYMSNQFMYWLVEEKGLADPRSRYYIYRQSSGTTNAQELPCIGVPAPAHYEEGVDVFCAQPNGYWGRDHLNADGIPPDNLKRATFGVYPVGGAFDNNNFASGVSNPGLKGAGIEPIMMSSFVHFMKAEAILKGVITGDAKAELIMGIDKSITRVIASGASLSAGSAYVPTAGSITAYKDFVATMYDDAANDNARLAIIVKEFMIANFGNGIEGYNAYRRTAMPRLQKALNNAPGQFYRTIIYPANFVNRNGSVEQKAQTVKVFWDNNADGVLK